jgi:predicted DNA-binding transcriptional regulator YafY
VAVSTKSAKAVAAALRSAGVRLDDDAVVSLAEGTPALPGTAEEAVGPRAIRTLLARAVEEQRQVWLRYFASSRGGATTERVVDPWSFSDDLLRGYCHLRQDERTFALDRVGVARLLPSGLEHPEPG